MDCANYQDLSDLRAQISELLAQGQLGAIKSLLSIGNPEIPMKGCPILSEIPIECRKQIWEYLLCNPLLGECFATDNNQAKFGLVPTLLRVNKQAYNEGMYILYGRNTFLIECITHESFGFGSGRVSFSALTRSQQLDRAGTNGDDSIIPAAKHVQHWKFVLSGTVPDPNLENSLSSLCRNIYMANIVSLDILIVPRGVERNWESDANYGDESQLAITLSPLERLRNVQRFRIRPAEFHEIPKVAFSSGESLAVEFIPILPDPVDEVRLLTLIEGNSEVERIEEMYKFLLKYAQTFERIEEFKLDMDRHKHEMGQNTFDVSELTTGYWTSSNPFESTGHPVEATLRAAKFAMMEDDMDNFKGCRAMVIHYLEPQYQNIEIASQKLADFIKEQKTKNGLFELNNRDHSHCLDVATEAMVLLEDYEASFYRQLEPATKIAIRKQKQLFITRYEALPREKLIKQCEIAYEKQWWERFIDHFKEAMNDIYTQYLAIREARKNLYASDLKSTVREVDVKPMLCDEMIDWNASEIDMRTNELDHKYQQYPENETAVTVNGQDAKVNGWDETSQVDVQNDINTSGEDDENGVSNVDGDTQDEDEQQDSVSSGSESGSEEGDGQLISDQDESDPADVSEMGENDQNATELDLNESCLLAFVGLPAG